MTWEWALVGIAAAGTATSIAMAAQQPDTPDTPDLNQGGAGVGDERDKGKNARKALLSGKPQGQLNPSTTSNRGRLLGNTQ